MSKTVTKTQAEDAPLSTDIGIDFMDGTWLNTTQTRDILGVSWERLRQIMTLGLLPVLPTPAGPLLRRADVLARREWVHEQYGRTLTVPEFCRGKGRHPRTPENTMIQRDHDRERVTCRPCFYARVDKWTAKNSEKSREMLKRATRAYQERKRQAHHAERAS